MQVNPDPQLQVARRVAWSMGGALVGMIISIPITLIPWWPDTYLMGAVIALACIFSGFGVGVVLAVKRCK